ncbi:MAG TPA: PTS sugar transporter subunit IIC [Longimicrobiales bacterium]
MTLLPVALWGGLVGLDAASFPQIMISRPLVAATVTGLIAGRPADGLALGIVLEAFALLTLPVGAARYPESGTAAVAAAAAYLAAAPAGIEPALVLAAVVFALAWERVGGASVHLQRRLNERLVAGWTASRRRPDREIERRHLLAMVLDYLRGAAIAAGGAWIGALCLQWIGPRWGFGAGSPVGVLIVATAAVIAALLHLFGGWSQRRLAFLLGVLCGCTLLLFR